MALKNKFSKDEPMLTTGIVAKMLGITPDRLRTYDTEKLINTCRVQTGQVQKRLYSQYDVEWLQCLRTLVKDNKMSITSVKTLLKIINANPKLKLPNDEIGQILEEMRENPNFKPVVENFS